MSDAKEGPGETLPVRVLHSEPSLGKVRALAWSGESDVLWAGTDSGVVLEVNLPDGPARRRFHAHKGGVMCAALCRKALITGGNDGRVRIWSTGSLECLAQMEAPGHRVHRLLTDSDEQTIWARTTNDRTAAWRLDGTRVAADEARFDFSPSRPSEIEEVSASIVVGETAWVAGRGAQRAGLLARLGRSDLDRTKIWRLPYAAACLALWRGVKTLYAGGNGRVFAIVLPTL